MLIPEIRLPGVCGEPLSIQIFHRSRGYNYALTATLFPLEVASTSDRRLIPGAVRHMVQRYRSPMYVQSGVGGGESRSSTFHTSPINPLSQLNPGGITPCHGSFSSNFQYIMSPFRDLRRSRAPAPPPQYGGWALGVLSPLRLRIDRRRTLLLLEACFQVTRLTTFSHRIMCSVQYSPIILYIVGLLYYIYIYSISVVLCKNE